MSASHIFESREAASAAAAQQIAARLEARLNEDEQVSFVVSGGTTPVQCFDLLSKKRLAWDRVQVALSDERWVPNDHADSNERLLREMLQKDAAARTSLLPVYQDDMTVDERCDSLQLLQPKAGFACAMVGMGADGHFASLFPGADSLEAGLDPDNRCFYIPVRTDASPHPRVSMTLAALLKSDEIVLLFFGEEKYRVYEKALAGDDAYPVTHLLRQQQVPVQIVWAA